MVNAETAMRLFTELMGRATQVRGSKKFARGATRYDLGCNRSGQKEYLISLEYDEGELEHFSTVKLAGENDPQLADESAPFFNLPWPDEVATNEVKVADPSPEELLAQLPKATGKVQISLICDAEALRFDQGQKDRLSPLLWEYIVANRDSTDHDTLVAVGSAIRKYIGILNVDCMAQIGSLLEAGHRAPLSLDLELEIAKMVYRKFEANPPRVPDPHPDLANRLWEMAQLYASPRLILREKYATVASLSIEAIVSMRSSLAEKCAELVSNSGFKFFKDIIGRDLLRLRDRWRAKNPEAANWCEWILNQNVR